MVSFPRAMLAGIAIGVVQALINFNYLDKPGLIDGLLLVAVLIAVALQSRIGGRRRRRRSRSPPRSREIPEQLRDVWWVKRLNVVVLGALLLFAILLPLLITQPSRHLLYATIALLRDLRPLADRAHGLGRAAVARPDGLRRVRRAGRGGTHRGLALDLGWRADLVSMPFLIPSSSPRSPLRRPRRAHRRRRAARPGSPARGQHLRVLRRCVAVPVPPAGALRRPHDGPFPRALFGLDLSSQRTYYYVCLAVLVVAFLVVSRLRRSGIGRTTITVRDNADRAAAYTVGCHHRSSAVRHRRVHRRFRRRAAGGAVEAVPFTERYFLVADSLALVALVVIGGIVSPMGAVLGSLWIVGLPAFFPDNTLVPLLTPASAC